MSVEELLPLCCGVEDDGKSVKLYLEGPDPKPSFDREQGVRTPLFHLFSGEDAEAIRRYLATHRAWAILFVPPDYAKERGVAALKIAAQWHSGQRSPLYSFASTRRVHGPKHQDQLRREVNALIGSVLENPVHPHEYDHLSLLREVINTAPLDTELATVREVNQ
jgi:hypothetical protein